MNQLTLFKLLSLYDTSITPENSKLHLAMSNDENILDMFFSNKFEEWQTYQSKRNFGRDLIISLIKLPQKDRWLFAGVFNSIKSKRLKNYYKYETSPVETVNGLIGRVIIHYHRPSRQSYPYAENCSEHLRVFKMLDKKLCVPDFPGFTHIAITKSTLDIIVKQEIPSWKAALSNVAGIYLITDKNNGKLYVGKASGNSGLWQRWCAYSTTGHGGNKELKEVLEKNDEDYSKNFQYSILETADTNASEEDILTRESHWKKILCTREHGYNSN